MHEGIYKKKNDPFKLTSNRFTPSGAHSGLIWILTVPVFPSSPPRFPISKVMIRPVLGAEEVSSAKTGLLVNMLASPPAKTEFRSLLKTSRRLLKAANSVVVESGCCWLAAAVILFAAAGAGDAWYDGTTKALVSLANNIKLSWVALRQNRRILLINIFFCACCLVRAMAACRIEALLEWCGGWCYTTNGGSCLLGCRSKPKYEVKDLRREMMRQADVEIKDCSRQNLFVSWFTWLVTRLLSFLRIRCRKIIWENKLFSSHCNAKVSECSVYVAVH